MIKVISGGQTGADQGGLLAATILGIPTGGTAPHGFKTETGNDPELLRGVYKLKQNKSTDYRARTYANCKDSEITLWFGHVQTPGYYCTEQGCVLGNSIFRIILKPQEIYGVEYQRLITDLKALLEVQDNLVINIAGNRESGNPGLSTTVTAYMLEVLQEFL